MISLSILQVRKVVGLGAICPCMDCLKVCVRVVGHSLMILTCGSFQMEQSCVYSSCQIGGAGCSMRAMPPLCWM